MWENLSRFKLHVAWPNISLQMMKPNFSNLLHLLSVSEVVFPWLVSSFSGYFAVTIGFPWMLINPCDQMFSSISFSCENCLGCSCLHLWKTYPLINLNSVNICQWGAEGMFQLIHNLIYTCTCTEFVVKIDQKETHLSAWVFILVVVVEGAMLLLHPVPEMLIHLENVKAQIKKYVSTNAL